MKLYAYSADGKLAEVSKELWTITDEAGTGVDTLTDGTLYELRVSVADGGAFDLSEAEKGDQNFRCTCEVRLKEGSGAKSAGAFLNLSKNTKSPQFLI